jgi:phage shock protein A
LNEEIEIMKKILSVLLSLTVIAGASDVFAKLSMGGSALSSSSKIEDVAKESKTKIANSIKKQADEYDKKAAEAEKAGSKDLAELYKKCSECYKTIADATESESKTSGATLSKAKKDLNDLQKQIKNMEAGANKPAEKKAVANKK